MFLLTGVNADLFGICKYFKSEFQNGSLPNLKHYSKKLCQDPL